MVCRGKRMYLIGRVVRPNAWSCPISIYTARFRQISDGSQECNGLTGSLPSSIGMWTNLTRIEMSWNELTGTIPTSVAQWTSLNTAILYNNNLTGTMPTIPGFCPKNGAGGVLDGRLFCQEWHSRDVLSLLRMVL
jgi:hypothetical protein